MAKNFKKANTGTYNKKLKTNLQNALDRLPDESAGNVEYCIFTTSDINQNDVTNKLHAEHNLYSKDMWSNFISYGINRGEFKNVKSEEIIDLIIFSYQGVRMFSTIMPIDEQIPNRIINHIKNALLI